MHGDHGKKLLYEVIELRNGQHLSMLEVITCLVLSLKTDIIKKSFDI